MALRLLDDTKREIIVDEFYYKMVLVPLILLFVQIMECAITVARQKGKCIQELSVDCFPSCIVDLSYYKLVL